MVAGDIPNLRLRTSLWIFEGGSFIVELFAQSYEPELG